VIDFGLARRLKESGLRWDPAPGDRFVIPKTDLLGQVFTLADMTIEMHRSPSGAVLAFNGTTEWALDSVEASEAVWLPAEHQLRSMLGGCFRHLRALADTAPHLLDPGDAGTAAYEVVADLPGVGERRFLAPVAEDAYAMAMLELLHAVEA
jgi:hypothetical protein